MNTSPLEASLLKLTGIIHSILMIHGLYGHAIFTWSVGDICWPRDLLPRALKSNVRILTFGYNAGRYGIPANLDIEDAAIQLVYWLEAVRSTLKEKTRPLIVIAHSLGGLVLKKALINVNNKQFLRHILVSLVGVIFLATPHRGSALASVADKLSRVTGLPQKFIRSLKQNSPELASIAEDFKQIADQRSLRIASFYELVPIRGRFVCFNDVVVYRESALLNIETELPVGVYVNHHEICKFRDADDPVFVEIKRCVKNLMEVPTRGKARIFAPSMVSPHFIGRRHYLQQIHEAFRGEDRSIVVIYGEGGMGKTQVALKYAWENDHNYDYIFFVNSTNVQYLEADFIALHRKLGLPKENGREVESMKEFMQRNRRWLIILDNDDDWLGLNEISFPETGKAHVIITCRGRGYNTDSRVTKLLHMSTLGPKHAKELLLVRAAVDLKKHAQLEVQAKNIIKRIGCQPLAVDSAAAYILQNNISIVEYLEKLKNSIFSRGILFFRPLSSKYQKSVGSILQITLAEIMKSDAAYRLLKLLVWLDRTKTTVSFLKRAVTPQLCWGPNGKSMMRDPRDSYVPEDVIELINGPGFDAALEKLTSYALITSDETSEEDIRGKDTIVIHPLTYNYVREALTADQLVENAIRALSLVVHAHPVLQAGLNESGLNSQAMIPQLFQCSLNREYLAEKGFDLTEALQKIKNEGKPSFAERTAEMFFEAIRGYGEGRDEVDRVLLKWLMNILRNSDNIDLQARLWCIRLPPEYYSRGKFIEGCEAADNFLQNIKSKCQELTERENAQIGFLRHLSVEYRVREKGLSDREVWEKRMAYIEAWQPLDPANPSELEKYAKGMGVRMRGKLAKDFGLFKEAFYSLKLFIEKYAKRGSREEGWAIGDFGQVILELEEKEEASEVLRDIISNGVDFGENRNFPSNAHLCQIATFICSRAVDNRMLDRGYLTPEDRENARENDTMFLEINHAVSVLREGRIHAQRYKDAEDLLLGLKRRFEKIRANGISWHDDQIREFSVIASLAQICHLQHDWQNAQSRWQQAIDYGETVIEKWDNDHFYIEVARCSLADVHLSAGLELGLSISDLAERIRQLDGKRVTWMLGLGSFWFDHLKQSVESKLKMENMRLKQEEKVGTEVIQ
ncbi:hypothetical protein PRK78_003628 [Emydomyces testavorans]|uniref:NB-ARC domain-containing protein n=1 Tax=Emydomyces testavorans TaxID=2070801 RepID=A0AAF0DJJ5_9EURO|nr:hypothetical protein PRK78_003628 [Emydomyces testavorans]